MRFYGKFATVSASAMTLVLAGCQTAAPPPAPPPVAAVVYAPRAPTPPFGASATTFIPALRADGLRQTVNRDLGPLETLWHVRSALNVAALGCSDPLYGRIVDDYNSFLEKNKRPLASANTAVLRKYQRENKGNWRAVHDVRQTQVYNYFSFSPLRRPFCDIAMQVGQRAVLVDAKKLNDFAATALPELEQPFTEFYLAFEQYQRDLEKWRVTYGSGQNGLIPPGTPAAARAPAVTPVPPPPPTTENPAGN
ncbi:MAG: hypothetical protein U5J78_05365 [Parasphingorhabdus sp.]|nr:hypothetical protein [Parasphingorhabdus sp.]